MQRLIKRKFVSIFEAIRLGREFSIFFLLMMHICRNYAPVLIRAKFDRIFLLPILDTRSVDVNQTFQFLYVQ